MHFEIRCAAGVAVPKLIVVCQNISEVNAKASLLSAGGVTERRL